MARFNITLPDTLRAQLNAEARQRSIKISTLIVQCVKEHCTGVSKPEHEAQLQKCRDENAILWHKVELFKHDTAENADTHDLIVKELQHELECTQNSVKRLGEQVVGLEKQLYKERTEKQN